MKGKNPHFSKENLLWKSFFLLLIVSAFALLKQFSSKEIRDRFSETNIRSLTKHKDRWIFAMQKEVEMHCRSILAQPFYQFVTGTQCHTFLSADGAYVLKFFRHARWRLPFFLAQLPLPEFLEKKRKAYQKKKEEVFISTFDSCISSYRDFQKETALIYLHLYPTTHLNITLTVYDRLGKKYLLKLDEIDFILQKRARRTDQYLLDIKQKGQTEKAKKAINSLLHFVKRRAEKGYFDKDVHFILNFGFINDRVVQIDTGSLYRDPEKGIESFYSTELDFGKKIFLDWMRRYYPELVSYTQNQIREMQEERKIATETLSL